MSKERCTLEVSTLIDERDGEVKAEFTLSLKRKTITFLSTEDEVLGLVVNLRNLVKDIRKRKKAGK